jgi:hypothetical protein
MSRRETLCHSLPLFHLMTIPLRSHPCPHCPVHPLMLPLLDKCVMGSFKPAVALHVHV